MDLTPAPKRELTKKAKKTEKEVLNN